MDKYESSRRNEDKPESGSSYVDYTSLGSCSCPCNGAPLPSCVFYSPRIQDFYKGEKTEFETATTHWTEVDPEHEAEVERIGKENCKYFDEVLVKHAVWGPFFSMFKALKLGEKIGEGGQAKIFAATLPGQRIGGKGLVAKVFKKKYKLKDMATQWPPQMLSISRENNPIFSGIDRRKGTGFPFRNILGAVFIREGEYKNRFAFVMKRQWGDLRTLIDTRMLELFQNNKHGPPFSSIGDVYRLIRGASNDMRRLHKAGVIHRDIKASNLLLANSKNVNIHELPDLMDFECSMGAIVGTKYWRAPEILKQLKNRVPCQGVNISKEADIYSFGMLCYEIITGCEPFEGHLPNDDSIIFERKIPRLPDKLNPILKQLVVDCWKFEPGDRPSAKEVGYRVEEFAWSIGLNPRVEPSLVDN